MATLQAFKSSDVRSGVIAKRLSALAPMTSAELELLQEVGQSRFRTHIARSILAAFGGAAPAPRYVVAGWAAHVRELHDGRRQILHLLLPGDSLGIHLSIRQRQHAVQAICSLQTVDGTSIWKAASDRAAHPGLSDAIDRAHAQERSFLLNQITRLGRQSAYERMAHLFVELRFRCSQVGLLQDESIPFPLTQEWLADLLGISGVHVNRTLQLLRHEGVIRLKHRRLYFQNLGALEQSAEFEPP